MARSHADETWSNHLAAGLAIRIAAESVERPASHPTEPDDALWLIRQTFSVPTSVALEVTRKGRKTMVAIDGIKWFKFATDRRGPYLQNRGNGLRFYERRRLREKFRGPGELATYIESILSAPWA